MSTKQVSKTSLQQPDNALGDLEDEVSKLQQQLMVMRRARNNDEVEYLEERIDSIHQKLYHLKVSDS